MYVNCVPLHMTENTNRCNTFAGIGVGGGVVIGDIRVKVGGITACMV